MRILHTSDWHIGKRLGRHDRMSECEEILAEVEHVADEHDVDLVLVSGDLFDRPAPPVEALRLGLETLVRLASGRPVVAVGGNHDSPELLEALAPLLRPMNVHLVGEIKRPDEGGVLEIDTNGGRAVVACFPFLREGRVVDFMRDAGEWYGQYADKVAGICRSYGNHLVRLAGGDAVPLLVAHFMVNGVKLGERGAPRGERALHIGQTYAATEQAIPPGPQYVAMGHIHAPQAVPASPVPAEYAGSLLSLDFGEAGEEKRVVLIEAKPGTLATRRSVPLAGGRRLVRASGTWEELSRRVDLEDSFLDLSVRTSGPEPGLADLVRERFPLYVHVHPDYPRAAVAPGAGRAGRALDELYADYCRDVRNEEEPPAELMGAFRAVLDEVRSATA